MENPHLYTKAELELMVIRHEEGRSFYPRKMLEEIKKEIRGRK